MLNGRSKNILETVGRRSETFKKRFENVERTLYNCFINLRNWTYSNIYNKVLYIKTKQHVLSCNELGYIVVNPCKIFSHVTFCFLLEHGVFHSEMDTNMDVMRENEKARVRTVDEL